MRLKKGIKELIAEAESEVETLNVEELAHMIAADERIQLIDIRDIRELWREGKIPHAYHAPRGMLEFWADPESPYHKEIFNTDKKLVLYCAAGARSALATKTLQDMGMNNIAHLGGGYGAWKEAAQQIEIVQEKI